MSLRKHEGTSPKNNIKFWQTCRHRKNYTKHILMRFDAKYRVVIIWMNEWCWLLMLCRKKTDFAYFSKLFLITFCCVTVVTDSLMLGKPSLNKTIYPHISKVHWNVRFVVSHLGICILWWHYENIIFEILIYFSICARNKLWRNLSMPLVCYHILTPLWRTHFLQIGYWFQSSFRLFVVEFDVICRVKMDYKPHCHTQ